MSFDNFIMEVPGAFNKKFCNKLIKKFEQDTQRHVSGVVGGGLKPETKKDTEIEFGPSLLNTEWKDCLITIVNQVTVHCKRYVEKYTFIDEHDDQTCGLSCISELVLEETFNMQKFNPGEGFYKWHCETGSDSNSYRQIVWMVYLNDIEERGGTLFKYQNVRCQPKAGKMVLWPAGWTHFHKSEVAPKETKYILTGWYRYKSIAQ